MATTCLIQPAAADRRRDYGREKLKRLSYIKKINRKFEGISKKLVTHNVYKKEICLFGLTMWNMKEQIEDCNSFS